MTYPPGQNPYGQSPYGGQNPHSGMSPYGAQSPYGGQPQLSPYGAQPTYGGVGFPAPAPTGSPGLAMASMICGIAVWVLCCGSVLFQWVLGASAARTASTGDGSAAAAMVGGSSIVGLALWAVQALLALAAVICGGIALGKKMPGKGFAITGTVLGGLFFLLCVGSAVVSVIAGVAVINSIH
ncbi:hypothetical protein [Segniliparus rugosus]|uniref:DUF4190 domain-containing protein n=1 Tax=Segniliparus rugosus (strain ATCC BAA-974 / DSM 45345 / CCUG 50838 / CIP 108380 / JCM 13579 / CDC 945) TaxID=679197 RepID=E5XST9_SEGRC|nr:hypothetical protein [Segniliparus rugosus]EFV12616.1 hypothetical protein HMPREF9336_02561 [Segniliparus rugosus ATCC BAA-974]